MPREEVAIFQLDRIIAWNTRIEPSQSLFIAIHFVAFHALQVRKTKNKENLLLIIFYDF